MFICKLCAPSKWKVLVLWTFSIFFLWRVSSYALWKQWIWKSSIIWYHNQRNERISPLTLIYIICDGTWMELVISSYRSFQDPILIHVLIVLRRKIFKSATVFKSNKQATSPVHLVSTCLNFMRTTTSMSNFLIYDDPNPI